LSALKDFLDGTAADQTRVQQSAEIMEQLREIQHAKQNKAAEQVGLRDL
jgi:hypothetical protein